MKSNLSTVMFLIITWLGKVKRTMVRLKPPNVGPRVTLVLVVTHGILQLVGLLPDNVMSMIQRRNIRIFSFMVPVITHEIMKRFCIDV